MTRNEKLFKRLDDLEADFAESLIAALRKTERAWAIFMTQEAAQQYRLHDGYTDTNRPFVAHAEDIIALRSKLNWEDAECLAARYLAACTEAHNLSDHHRGSTENIARALLDTVISGIPKDR